QTATALASAPPFIRNAMLFGSTTGFRLVRDRWQAAGFAGVDSLYRSPPGSTAQVLHPLRRPLGPTPPPPVLPNLGATGCTPVRPPSIWCWPPTGRPPIAWPSLWLANARGAGRRGGAAPRRRPRSIRGRS